ncbi:hypothetical protein D3C78_1956600 [compost metagenome]
MLQFLLGLGQLVLTLVDLLGIAFFHGLVQITLTLSHFVLGLQHLIVALFAQTRIGAVFVNFTEGFLKT